eukprot:gene8790-10417_t
MEMEEEVGMGMEDAKTVAAPLGTAAGILLWTYLRLILAQSTARLAIGNTENNTWVLHGSGQKHRNSVLGFSWGKSEGQRASVGIDIALVGVASDMGDLGDEALKVLSTPLPEMDE